MDEKKVRKVGIFNALKYKSLLSLTSSSSPALAFGSSLIVFLLLLLGSVNSFLLLLLLSWLSGFAVSSVFIFTSGPSLASLDVSPDDLDSLNFKAGGNKP